AENLRNGVWAKITLQDFIVKKWVEENIINEDTYDDFKNLNIYSKDKDYSLFWSTPVVRKLLRAYQSYDLMTDDDIAVSPEPLYDFETEVNNTSLNLYDIQIPESVLNDAEFGQPQSITFLYDGNDIFTSYPDAISNRTNIAGTEIPKSFTLNLSAYPALKNSGEFNVTVDYGNDNRKYAADYLFFSPEITSVAVLSAPDQWVSDDFSLDVEICGDETSFVNIFYKKAEDSGFPLFDYTSFRLANPTNIDGDCRTYSVTVDGWKLMYLLGGNRDVSLLLKAYGTSATVGDRQSGILTKYLVNLNDLDNDNLPDSWEEQYFEDRFAYSAADDPDGDGVDNIFEYQHVTDPTKPGAEGVIESIIFQPIELSSGDWQYDFSLSGIYWANVVHKNVTLTIYEDEAVVQGGFSLESGTLDLNGRTLVIMGDLVQSNGVLNVNGGQLIVKGELHCSGGTINLNNGEVTTEKTFLQSGGELNVNGGKLIVKGDYRIQKKDGEGYTYSFGKLKMENDADYVLVEGDFVTDGPGNRTNYYGTIYNEPILTAGTLEVRGNFTQLSTNPDDSWTAYNFQAAGTHKVILSGTETQTVSFEDAMPNLSHFNILEITNPDPTKITFNSGEPTTSNIVYSSTPLSLRDLNIGKIGLTLPMDMKIILSEGRAFGLYDTTLDLNGHTLTVEGDFLQSGGTVNVNGGRLIVRGDYRIQEKTADGEYTYSRGRLKMENDADYVLVEGDFVTDGPGNRTNNYGTIYNEPILTAGTLELRGDFTQLSTNEDSTSYTAYNFQTTGNHRVILSGSGPQTVSFEYAGSSTSRFNELLLTTNTLKTFTTGVAVTKLF
ncbi:MAG: hypothetical protein D3906_07230, partial [Candidatus Electrothrix sp. AUS1_2]|nr:hypothetical protein [Candidatus Electrothrix sp. AUS1_2]